MDIFKPFQLKFNFRDTEHQPPSDGKSQDYTEIFSTLVLFSNLQRQRNLKIRVFG